MTIGTLTGDQAKECFSKYGLSRKELAKIWYVVVAFVYGKEVGRYEYG